MPRLNFALWLLLCCCQCQALSGFKEIPMPPDGDCLYWSVAAGNNLLENRPLKHELSLQKDQLRQQVMQKLEGDEYDEIVNLFLISDENPHETKADYLQGIKQGDWGGELELWMLSRIMGKELVVHSHLLAPLRYAPKGKNQGQIHLFYNGSHYNLLTEQEAA